ncbi:MAG TPA: hypothetical protein PKD72_16155, partial [Gemmatales bacterium]|nr:hypothetical protein [Gemmatales bacterium]
APVTEFNPVQDTLLTLGELLAAINPTTYLMSLPAENVKQKNATVAAATTFAADAPPATTPGVVETEAVPVRECCTPSDTCPGSAKGVSCKVASPGEVVVRTYSVAEFSTTSGTHHEELIRLITTMVSPESWNHKDATMEYFPLGKCLVVRHCVSVQDQVEDLLTQLRNQVIRQQNAPVIRRERTEVTPVELEVVPVVPREDCQQLPRVITVETNRCMDEEVMSLMPITPDGRLVPVPMEPMKGSKAIVPTQYEPAPEDTGWFYDGYLQKKRVSTVPGYFPLFLPYAPLPEAPANYEEQQVQHVSYVRYSMAEVDAIMCSAFESEDKK